MPRNLNIPAALLAHVVVGDDAQACEAQRCLSTLIGESLTASMLINPQTVGEHTQGGGDALVGFGGIEIVNPAGMQVSANQLQKFHGEKAGTVITGCSEKRVVRVRRPP